MSQGPSIRFAPKERMVFAVIVKKVGGAGNLKALVDIVGVAVRGTWQASLTTNMVATLALGPQNHMLITVAGG